MIKNSRKRLMNRRTSALMRRMANLVGWNAVKRVPSDEAAIAEFDRKIAICETDIANLQAKGVRV